MVSKYLNRLIIGNHTISQAEADQIKAQANEIRILVGEENISTLQSTDIIRFRFSKLKRPNFKPRKNARRPQSRIQANR